MRSFSNITLKFANKLHLLVDSLEGIEAARSDYFNEPKFVYISLLL